MAHGQDRLGCPCGWLRDPSYSLRVELDRPELSAPWQLDDWAAETWDATDTAPPE